jgi:hypothetical protein
MDLLNRQRTSYLSDVVLRIESQFNCQANATSYRIGQRQAVITYLHRPQGRA